ncbi:MAG: tripartite tricarboxylate transporter substrate binding protein [Burkholderiales bacterium]|jgi:tripartite-type tricarboxylate transporter receptor subunit TctC|nr:tripartite tricarboxylate transporter substrate binding protein [Burkholderiales bacterium]
MTRARQMMASGARRRQLLAAAAALPLAAGASAPVFPSRTVRIIVPYSVGIGPDVVSRTVAMELERRWSQPVVIENKPGASGIVAFNELRQTAPDGHTLFVGDTGSLAVNPLIHASLPYDVERDIAPLTTLFRATFVLHVSSKSRFNSLGELIAQARKAPRSVSYASFGNGHPSHVAVETFARAANLDLLHVPFKDGGTQMSAVANGDVDFTTLSMNTMMPLIKAGKIRPLAVAARTRLAEFPDIPTFAEAGGPPVEMRPWAGLVARAGTPAPILQQLHRDLMHALGTDAVRERIEAAGFQLAPSTPQQMRDLIAADVAQYTPLVREGRVTKV